MTGKENIKEKESKYWVYIYIAEKYTYKILKFVALSDNVFVDPKAQLFELLDSEMPDIFGNMMRHLDFETLFHFIAMECHLKKDKLLGLFSWYKDSKKTKRCQDGFSECLERFDKAYLENLRRMDNETHEITRIRRRRT